jgi:cytochrome c peroxidase
MTRKLRQWTILVAIMTLAVASLIVGQGLAQTELTDKEQLGSFLYFDENLSEPSGQSCASCHHPDSGFVDPDVHLPVSEGVVAGLFGGRNSPSSAYAMYAPEFHFDGELWIGGQFWDGRATGYELGDPLADQALGPFTNAVEMANPDRRTVIRDVAGSTYKDLYESVWPGTDLDTWEMMSDAEVDAAYEQVALSIAAFERSGQFAPFTSKYDAYLQACLAAGGNPANCATGTGQTARQVGQEIFTSKEWDGLQLFMNENNDNNGVLDPGEGAMCAACHVAAWTDPADYGPLNVQVPDWSGGMIPPVFTDFSFDNLGVPKNEEYPLTGAAVDQGLGAFLEANPGLFPGVDFEAEYGKFKVMTLRNIDLTPPYAHNGLFKSVEEITHFYNTRDALDSCDLVKHPKPGKNCWPLPEYAATVNFDELGNLGLGNRDEKALVEFMKTLSDGWTP